MSGHSARSGGGRITGKKRVAFHTLGCKVNQADTDSMAGAFAKRGYEIVDFDSDADVYVVNTCTVTNLADRKSRQMLRRAVRKNSKALIVATGCFAQTEGAALADAIPGIHIVAGTRGRTGLVDLVEEKLAERELRPASFVEELTPDTLFEEFDEPSVTGRSRATLKIEEGCEEYCSYCKIPYARGPVRSRNFERIVGEVHRLAAGGFKEIILTGIHLGHYGRDIGYQKRLSDVVKAVAGVDGIERVRLSSIDPTDVTPELIALAADNPKVCRHFHIPLQGGHNDVLKAMNRKYTLEEYAALIRRIREAIPEVAVSTDIIVGFPGETDGNFESTLSFAAEMEFAKLHVFKYSIRSGTPAASFENQVSPEVKDSRSERLIRLGDDMALGYNSRFIGKELGVLFESVADTEAGAAVEGLTDNYIRVKANVGECRDPDSLLHDLHCVTILSATSDGVSGRVVEDFNILCRK
jgi:threonylcarbamoyladenosine tRNA methylthiotransferase MtaB